MQVLDIIFLIPIVFFAYRGFSRGIITEVSTLLALILGVIITVSFSDYTHFFLKEHLPNFSYGLSLLSYIITFVLVIMAVRLLGKLVSKLVHALALGFINRLAGLIFGALKAIIVMSVLVLLFENINTQFELHRVQENESLLYPYFKRSGLLINELFSSEVGFSSHVNL